MFIPFVPFIGHRNLRGLGQAACLYIRGKDIVRALVQLSYLRPGHTSYDDAAALAYGEWYDSSGIDSFFGLQVSEIADTGLVQVCPAEAWTQLEAQARMDLEEQEGPVAAPDSSIPSIQLPPQPPSVTINPLGPPEDGPPATEAGVASGWKLLGLGLAAGFGTWLLLRKVY